MLRLIVVGTLLAVLGGCLPHRAAAPESVRPRFGPVGTSPIPNLRESINADLRTRDVEARRVSGPRLEALPELPPERPEGSAFDPAALPPLPVEPEPSEAVSGPSTATSEPGEIVSPPLPGPEAGPPPGPPPGLETAATIAPPPDEAPIDRAVQPAQSNPAELKSRLESGKIINLTVVTVGTETISRGELQEAVQEWVRSRVPKGQKISGQDFAQISRLVLESLVDRAILVQEARRSLLKGDKQRQAFDDFVDKVWREQEVPKLVKRYGAKSDRDLRQELEAQGRSLEIMRERFRRETMAREFLHSQLQARLVTPEIAEIFAYYRDHLHDYDRPAQVVWREIVVKHGPNEDRAAARQKAEMLWNRLRRGEDFAAVATAESQGATAEQGGAWVTEPDASSAPSVNAALRTLPINQVSAILEAPASFHMVRVESRREAGPASFEEVQNEVRTKLQELAFEREVESFTKELREKTLITYHFKDAPHDDAARPASHP